MSNNILDNNMDELLDAYEALREFQRKHPNDTTRQQSPTEFIIEVSAEQGRLSEAYVRARTEYEAAIRKDERERIKALIDSQEP